MSERYVVLGLAPARKTWLSAVSRWANAAIVPIEFVRCVSADELVARLGSGRAYSAALIDADVVGLDRDLIGFARERACPVVVVDSIGVRDWVGLGAAACVENLSVPDALIEALRATAVLVPEAITEVGEPRPAESRASGRLIVVTGPGGTGASMTAIALAQGLARTGEVHGRLPAVLLADLCRTADQAMLHDARTLVPGLPELVDAHRFGIPSPRDVRAATFAVNSRGYRLLLGLRRPEQWTTISPRALEATLESLRDLADWVVVDVESDVENVRDGGSPDIEHRQALARQSLARADAVLIVGEPSFKGIHALVRTTQGLRDASVPGDRLITAIVGAPISPRGRIEIRAALRALLDGGAERSSLTGPVFVPRRRVDQCLRDGTALPKRVARQVADVVVAAVARTGRRELAGPEGPVRVDSLSVMEA